VKGVNLNHIVCTNLFYLGLTLILYIYINPFKVNKEKQLLQHSGWYNKNLFLMVILSLPLIYLSNL